MMSLTLSGVVRALPVAASEPEENKLPLAARVAQWLCAMSAEGHELIRKTEGRRMYLTCRKCLHETPGWTIETRH